jgi:hypothetical protein
LQKGEVNLFLKTPLPFLLLNNNKNIFTMKNLLKGFYTLLIAGMLFSCNAPAPPKKSTLKVKHNYIVLLDLSDRLIVQENQPARDIEIIQGIYRLFENRVKKNLYIKSRDEIKVVIAPQKGSGLKSHIFEDRLYVNMENINNMLRHKEEAKREQMFYANLDTLYKKAVFSKNPSDFYGADIWKYFYEDLNVDYSKDTLTKNFLFILTDGYPIVGKDRQKLQPIKDKFSNLHVVLIEAAPRDKDMEWDSVINTWTDWFAEIGVKKYTLIKRSALTKEIEQLKELVRDSR